MDKPTKPSNLIPRSFGGVKNNFSASLQSSGYEDGVPAIYGGDNLNYQLDATGKELDYCETICDYINAIPIGKTPIVNANNKLVYTRYDIRVYETTETYAKDECVTGYVDGNKQIFKSLQDNNINHALTDTTWWEMFYMGGFQPQIDTINQTLNTHINNTSNPHSVTKSQIGLGNCDNTSDLNKPISTATQTALNGKANASLNNVTSGAFGNVLSTASSTNKVTVSGWGYPNWAQKVSKEANTSYTAGQKGWVCARAESGNAQASLEVNGITVAETYPKGGQDYGAFACLVPVDWADTYQLISTTTTNRYLYFIPIKGY